MADADALPDWERELLEKQADAYALAEEWARKNGVAGAGDVIAAFVAGWEAGHAKVGDDT